MMMNNYDQERDLLKPLKGLTGLDEDAIEKWKNDNALKLEKYGLDTEKDMNKLYMLQQVKSTYGNSYKKMLKDTDSENDQIIANLYKDMVIHNAVVKRGDPYDVDHFGVNPSKGFGNDYEEILSWPTDLQLKLMTSDYRTEEEIKERQKLEENTLQSLNKTYKEYNDAGDVWNAGWTSVGISGAIQRKDDTIAEKIIDIHKERVSAAILHDLKMEHDKQTIVEPLRGEINAVTENMASTVPTETTKKNFEEFIKFTPTSTGIPTYAAFYKDGDETREDEMKGFKIDDMRKVMAQVEVYRKHGVSEDKIKEIIENDAKDYVEKARSFWKDAEVFGKDVLISASAYLGQKVQAVEFLGLAAADGYDRLLGELPSVYIDDTGTVVPSSKVELIDTLEHIQKPQDSSQFPYNLPSPASLATRESAIEKIGEDPDRFRYYYTNDEGEKVPVVKVQKSRTELKWMGKDTDGEDLELWHNPILLEKAQKYVTLDKNYIKEADKLGVSIYAPTFGSDQEGSILYESGKMASFVVGDYTVNLLAGTFNMLGNMASKLAMNSNRVLSGIGHTGVFASKVIGAPLNPIVQASVSAGGIGVAYGGQSYSETYQNNMEIFSKHIYEQAVANAENVLKENEGHMPKELYYGIQEELVKSLVEKYGEEEAREYVKVNQAALEEQAMKIAYQKLVDNELNKIKNTNEYYYGLNEASANASMAANNVALLNGLKYVAINNWGYRRFLFSNPNERLQQDIFKQMQKYIKSGKGFSKDMFNQQYSDYWKKAIHMGKSVIKSGIFGGGLGNLSDDMMVDAAESLAGGAFKNYIRGYDKGLALDSYSTLGDALIGIFNGDYFAGGLESLSQSSTWNAGIVGAMGSAVSPFVTAPFVGAGYHTLFKTKDYKAALAEAKGRKLPVWKTAKFWQVMTQHSFLSEYVAEKETHRRLSNAAIKAEDFLKNKESIDIVTELLRAKTLANTDDEATKRTGDFLTALTTIRGLNHFNKENEYLSEGEKYAYEAVIKSNDSFTQITELWQNIINGTLTDAQKKDLIEEYYAKNPTLEKTEDNNQKALEDITHSASKLNEASQRMDAAIERINDFERKNPQQKRLSASAKNKIITYSALGEHMKERLFNMEKEISGSETNDAAENDVVSLIARGNTSGVVTETRKSIDNEKIALDESRSKSNTTIKELQKEQEDILKEYEKAKEDKKEEIEERLTTNLNKLALAKEENAKIEQQIETNKKRKESFDSALKTLQDEYSQEHPNSEVKLSDKQLNVRMTASKLFGFNVDLKSNKSLEKAEDYLRKLNPYTRAKIFKLLKEYKKALNNKDFTYAAPFEGKLMEVLSKVYDRIAQKDATIIDKIIDVPTVMSQQQLTETEIDLALSNPDAYMYKEGIIENAERDTAYELEEHRTMVHAAANIERIDSETDRMFKTPVTEKEKNDIAGLKNYRIRNYLKNYSSKVLKRLLNAKGKTLSTYRPIIQEVLGLRESYEKIATTVFEKAYKAQKEALGEEKASQAAKEEVSNVLSVISEMERVNEITTKKQLLEVLEATSESSLVNDETRRLAGEIFNLLTQVGEQESSTVSSENLEEQKEAREKRRKKAKEDRIKRLKEEAEKEEQLKREKEKKEREDRESKAKKTNIHNIQIVEYEDGTIIYNMIDKEGKVTPKNRPILDIPKDELERATTESNKEDVTGIRIWKYKGEKDGKYVYQAEVSLKNGGIKDEEVSFDHSVHERAVEEFKKKREIGVNPTEVEIINKQPIDLGIEPVITVDEETGEAYMDTDKSIPETQGEAAITSTPFDEIAENEIQNSDTEFIGNPMYRYDFDALKEDGYIVERTGAQKNDKLNQFFGWMEFQGIKYQEIIDNELADILIVEKDIHFITIRPDKNNPYNSVMQKEVLTAVKYTPEVAKIHNKEYGGVVETNDGKYLIIGTIGYRSNGDMADAVHKFQDKLKAERMEYLNSHPDTQFYVSPSTSTVITNITPGYIVRKLATDEAVQIRTLSELLEDKNRNPEGLAMEDVKWGIQQNGKFKPINLIEGTYRTPSAAEANVGNVFMMVKSASGIYIPIAMKTVTYSKVRDGMLKSQIVEALTELTSPNFNDRKDAARKLTQIFHFDKNNKTILYGKDGVNVLSIVNNGEITRSFTIDEAFNREEFFAAVKELDPIINLTTSVLSNPSTLLMYDKAGVLLTDAAKIGTAGAHYSIAAIDAKGNMITPTPVETNTTSRKHSELARATYPSVVINKEVYRYKKEQWVDATDNPITDINLLNTIYYNYTIENGKMSPIYENTNTALFMMDSANMLMVARNKATKNIRVLTKEEAQRQIDNIQSLQEKQKKAKEAQRQLDAFKEQQEEMDREISIDGEGFDASITSDSFDIDDIMGIPNEKPTENKSEKIKKEKAIEDSKKEDSEKPKSLIDFKTEETKAPTNLEGILNSVEHSERFFEILFEKGWEIPDNTSKLSEFLKLKGINTTNIRDLESWLKEIKDCL